MVIALWKVKKIVVDERGELSKSKRAGGATGMEERNVVPVCFFEMEGEGETLRAEKGESCGLNSCIIRVLCNLASNTKSSIL